MKLPAFQFYPGDWKKDPGIQSLTLEDRGAWWEILLLMHECVPRGYLMLNDRPMPVEALAVQLHVDATLLNQITTKLVSYGVMKVDEATGRWYCKRMVRDEEIRQIRKKAGSLGGNPALLNQNSTKKQKVVNQNATPSVSASIATTVSRGASPFDEDDNPPQHGKRKPKSVGELQAYCVELGLTALDGEHLWDYWEVNGWKRGKSTILDWKANVRTFKRERWCLTQKNPELRNGNGASNRPPPEPDRPTAEQLAKYRQVKNQGL